MISVATYGQVCIRKLTELYACIKSTWNVRGMIHFVTWNPKPCPINPLWPSDVIWRQVFRSTLAQVMACCLTAPRHYLNQCWLMIMRCCGIPLIVISQKYLRYSSLKWVWNLLTWDCSQMPQGPMSKGNQTPLTSGSIASEWNGYDVWLQYMLKCHVE